MAHYTSANLWHHFLASPTFGGLCIDQLCSMNVLSDLMTAAIIARKLLKELMKTIWLVE
jgi:hypothetical protein